MDKLALATGKGMFKRARANESVQSRNSRSVPLAGWDQREDPGKLHLIIACFGGSSHNSMLQCDSGIRGRKISLVVGVG